MVKIVSVMFMMTVISVGAASTARAESVVAKVPFDFIVGNMRLPAGEYVVTETSPGSAVLAITSADGRDVALMLTIPSSPVAPAAPPQLVFKKFSNHYFLEQVVPQVGDEREIILTPSLMEREIAGTADQPGN